MRQATLGQSPRILAFGVHLGHPGGLSEHRLVVIYIYRGLVVKGVPPVTYSMPAVTQSGALAVVGGRAGWSR